MRSLAEQIREYIRARAEVEGVEFDLSLEFFEGLVAICGRVFGVRHNGVEMLYDELGPYPGFFAQMKKELEGCDSR